MKFSLHFIIMLLCCGFDSKAQDEHTATTQRRIILDYHDTKFSQPLYIINADQATIQLPPGSNYFTRRKIARAIRFLDRASIDSVRVVKGMEATDKYGAPGKNGVIVMRLKDGQLNMLPRRLKKYKIQNGK